MTALEFHPLADIFPLLEGRIVRPVIKEQGLHEPVRFQGPRRPHP
jgi:hypothetical protein